LHFEKNDVPFSKSECKNPIDRKKTLHCGTGEHPEDCYGKDCVVGKIKANNYLAAYGKARKDATLKATLQRLTEEDLYSVALENAAWLRYKMQTALHAAQGKLYLLNPYTTMDNLLKSILNITENYHFAPLGSAVTTKKYTVKIDFFQQYTSITFSNHSKTMFVFTNENINKIIYLSHYQLLILKNSIEIKPNETQTFNVHFQKPISVSKLYFRLDNDIWIFEL
jgi:hypothetical protein